MVSSTIPPTTFIVHIATFLLFIYDVLKLLKFTGTVPIKGLILNRHINGIYMRVIPYN